MELSALVVHAAIAVLRSAGAGLADIPTAGTGGNDNDTISGGDGFRLGHDLIILTDIHDLIELRGIQLHQLAAGDILLT